MDFRVLFFLGLLSLGMAAVPSVLSVNPVNAVNAVNAVDAKLPLSVAKCVASLPEIASPITFKQGNGDGWGLDFRPHTFNNVSINGAGNIASVVPGSNVTLSYTYSVNFLEGYQCATCVYFQEYVGLLGTNKTVYCNNFIESAPGGKVSVTFEAPTTPGIYWLIGVYEFQAVCKDFWQVYEPSTEGRGMPFAAIKVECPPLPEIAAPITFKQGSGDGWGLDSRPHVFSAVSVNGGGNTAYVAANSMVNVSYNYETLASTIGSKECETCYIQEYVGLSGTNQTISCSNFIGSVNLPNGKVSTSFQAPSAPGLYWLVGVYEFQYDCKPMWTDYEIDMEHGRGMPFAAIRVVA